MNAVVFSVFRYMRGGVDSHDSYLDYRYSDTYYYEHTHEKAKILRESIIYSLRDHPNYDRIDVKINDVISADPSKCEITESFEKILNELIGEAREEQKKIDEKELKEYERLKQKFERMG